MKIAQRALSAQPFHAMSIGARAWEIEAQGHHVAKLSLGEPSFGAPPAVREAERAVMDGRDLAYSLRRDFPTCGRPSRATTATTWVWRSPQIACW